MKRKKEQEAEARKVYDLFWDSYFSGDENTFVSVLDDEFKMIGTSETEVCHNKAEAITFFRTTTKEISGKAELRNREISLVPLNGLILINEMANVYALIETEWRFYSKIRLSTLLHDTETGWKVVHQHGSMPDSRVQEGETLAFEQIKTENLQLRDAVSRRTVELEHKNRELEIETSLERVRAVAMGMKQPTDMLEVCHVICDQLQLLHVPDLRNVQTAIISEGKGAYMNYQYFTTYQQGTVEVVEYNKHPKVLELVQKMQQSPDAFFSTAFEGEELQVWRQYRKDDNQFPDPKLDDAKAVFFYFYSIGQGGLGISAYTQLNEEDIAIFHRFRNVFALAYGRFMDIEQAEAQAKEARIELALERVRARAMAMQNSDELAELVSTVFRELTHLDFVLTSCIIWINNPELDTNTLWVTSSEMDQPARPIFLTPFHHSFFKSIIQAWKVKDPKWIYELSGEEKRSFEEAFFKEARDLPDALKSALAVPEKVAFSASFNNFGAVEVLGTEPLSDEKFDILHRFGRVFDLSYTRFNDLKKAEAQAREAKIEASLERVRAMAMSMRRPEELIAVCEAIHKELIALGFTNIRNTQIAVNNDTTQSYLNYEFSDYGLSGIAEVPYNCHPLVYAIVNKMKESKDAFFQIEISGAELDEWRVFRVKNLRQEVDVRLDQAASLCYYFYSVGTGALGISTFNSITDGQLELLKRFRNVFELSYRRYTDVAQAEAQAREARIELALERVRARAMAMQNSNELSELVDTVFKELTKLDFALNWCIINIIDESSMSNTVWAANPDIDKAPESYHMLFEDYPFHHAMMKGWKEGKTKYVYVLEGLEKKIYDKYLFSETEFRKVPEAAQAASRAMEKYVVSFSFSNFGGLQTVGDVPLSDTNLDILSRFGNVFDLTYTRFNDLKLAEAQAREAQIQLALERIRARTMAMHNSDELAAVASVVFAQLSDLGIRHLASGFVIFDKHKPQGSMWMSYQGGTFPKPFDVNFAVSPVLMRVYNAWKEEEAYYINNIEGEPLVQHIQLLKKEFGRPIDEVMERTRQQMLSEGKPIPDKMVMHHTFFKNGSLVLHNFTSIEEQEILNRFANVFDQTYTRFLDLKKTEAQAREAQIEAALEKVRSRSLAMHKSDELQEVVHTVFEKMNELNVEFFSAIIFIFLEGSRDIEWWLENKESQQYPRIRVPYDDNHYQKDIFEAREKGKDFLSVSYSLEEKDALFHHLFENTDFKYVPEKQKQFLLESEFATMSVALAENTAMSITRFTQNAFSEKENALLKRFAKVFDQAYTRFRDLQNAEAQAREAQIEAALERVRSRTMAMQKSQELKEVIQVVYEQFTLLNIQIDHTGFVMDYKRRDDYHIWIADRVASPTEVTIPYFDCVYYNQFNEAKEKSIEFFATNLTFEEKNKFYQDLFKHVPGLPEEALEFLLQCPGLAASTVLLENVCLYIENFSGIPYTDEENNTLMRFGNVFQQTYTRFLDLQKAEAQAREAKIEAALERVRSRTMAMQISSELGKVAAELFAQMSQLVTNLWTCGFVLCEKNRDEDEWWLSMDGDFTRGFFLPNIGDYAHTTLYEGWLKGDALAAVQLDGEVLQQHYDWLMEIPVSRAIFEEMDAAGLARPDWQKLHAAYFSKGYLVLITREPCGEEEIFKRFAQVFDQTYTRFLDLQKAEAQVREAKIEASLERTRTQSMLMQHSKELDDTLRVFHEQVLLLGINSAFSFLWLPDEKNDRHIFWAAWGEKKNGSTVFKSKAINYPLDRNEPATAQCLVDWKGTEPIVSYHVAPAGVENYFAAWQELIDGVEKLKPEYFSGGLHYVEAFMKYGCFGVMVVNDLTEDEKKILGRFAIEFERTYTRFLDLQKAEANAREAQIEAALERVRSRTMAMHKSEELLQVITVVAEQLQQLNFKFGNVSFAVRNQDHDYKFWFSGPGLRSPYHIHVPYINNPMFERVRHFQKEDLSIYTDILSIEESSQWHQHVFENSELKSLPAQTREYILNSGYARTIAFMPTIMLIIGNYASQPYTEEENNIFKRFASVFEQSYTRFLDLQRAEAQAREGQIQLAMERVRARTMAMQKSEELPEAANLLFQQVQSLGMPAWSAGYCIWDEDKKAITLWMSSEGVLQPPFKLPLTEDPSCIHFLEAHQRGETFYVEEIGGEELVSHYRYMRSLPVVGEVLQAINDAGFPLPTFQIFHCAYFSKGFLLFITYEPVPEAHDIFKRFGKVFEQTYTRFLDLQKAEAQAREAQIEAALERVRSRTMGMGKTDELTEIIGTIFTELSRLNVALLRCVIEIYNSETYDQRWWMANAEDAKRPVSFYIKYIDLPPNKAFVNAWKEKLPKWVYLMKGDIKREWDQRMLSETELSLLPESVKTGMRNPAPTYCNTAFNNYGCLTFVSTEALPDDQFDILIRFAKVFDQTYTRFNDLQKAEAQAREAQIEVALERVRSKAMAMHKSEDLSGAVATVFEELDKLSLGMLRCGIGILDKEKPRGDIWITVKSEHGDTVQVSGDETFEVHPLLLNAYQAWRRQEDYYYVLQGNDLASYYKALTTTQFQSQMSETFLSEEQNQQQYYFNAVFQDGSLFAFLETPITDEVKLVMKRFAGVFNLTYKRFLDIQNAESNAREAQIEAALERVRGKAMAMQTSNDLSATASTVFVELRKLGIHSIRSGVGLLTQESRKVILYAATSSEEGVSLSLVGWVMLQEHPVLSEIYDSWIRHEDYFPILKGELLQSYYAHIISSFSVPGSHYKQYVPDNALTDANSDYAQHGYFLAFSEGFLYGWSEKPYMESEIKILTRFKLIIDLTFRRYIELQKSEANARDAIRQASLDRVRAETASMRTTNDLEKITPLVWNELTTLGVPFTRCGVFIMDDEAKIVHTYLSTAEGKDIAAIHLPYNGMSITEQVVAHWRNQSVYTEHWDKTAFHQWTKQLIDQGHISSTENYHAGTAPDDLHLHFVPFTQGMLYVGSAEPHDDESLSLIRSLANAFATAYARYEDFNKLEAAKKKTDLALADLESAKDQLVQQEKLASLGQLTAGIAHEIKNPLNFVNNFSEVSMELLDEMLEELEKGNSESVKSISDDIKANLDKIHEHGSRADSIVKSMLLHSRGGSGQKEPTDLNALIREYVNLTFHGMRAGKQPINVKIELNLDETMGPVPVIVEDISRVIVNLCNNAFDAMRSKLSDPSQNGGYTPKLTVRTKWDANHVKIEIADNGPGIPDDIKDKILQPFFTTKKGTQGTGLGLSITNDIVKAHGGELRVESKEGEGSEFIMVLPIV